PRSVPRHAILVTEVALPWWLATCVAALAAEPVVQPGPVASIDVVPSEAFAEAQRAFDEGRWSDAASQLHALAASGAGPRSLQLEAGARYEAGDIAAAEQAARRSLEATPEDPPALAILGLVLAEEGRGDEALAVLRHAVQAA